MPARRPAPAAEAASLSPMLKRGLDASSGPSYDGIQPVCRHASTQVLSFEDCSLSVVDAGYDPGHDAALPNAAGELQLLWTTRGCLYLEQDGRQTTIGSGQATILDARRPHRARFSREARLTVFAWSPARISGWRQLAPRLCGTPLPDDPSLRAALASLTAIAVNAPAGSADGCRAVLQAVQWMLSDGLHRWAGTFACGGRPDPRFDKARRYVLEHLSDPRLTADHLAAALCTSRRTLYSVFGQQGTTPARLILRLRLERSRAFLCDPAQQGRKIIDLAFESGFGDYASFSRLFKQHYGLAPSQCRRRGAPPLD